MSHREIILYIHYKVLSYINYCIFILFSTFSYFYLPPGVCYRTPLCLLEACRSTCHHFWLGGTVIFRRFGLLADSQIKLTSPTFFENFTLFYFGGWTSDFYYPNSSFHSRFWITLEKKGIEIEYVLTNLYNTDTGHREAEGETRRYADRA